MIFKDLLEQCSAKDIVQKIMAVSSVDDDEQASVSQTYLTFIGRLMGIEPVDTGRLLLGALHLEDGKEHTEALVYRKMDLIGISDNLTVLSQEKLRNICETAALPESCAFELASWEKILGYELIPDNVSDSGPVELAAVTVYKMTVFGFTEEEVETEKQKMAEVLSEEASDASITETPA